MHSAELKHNCHYTLIKINFWKDTEITYVILLKSWGKKLGEKNSLRKNTNMLVVTVFCDRTELKKKIYFPGFNK